MRSRNNKSGNDSVKVTRALTAASPSTHPIGGAVVLGVGTRSEILRVIRDFARSVQGATGAHVVVSDRFSIDPRYADESRHELTSYVGSDTSWIHEDTSHNGTTLHTRVQGERR